MKIPFARSIVVLCFVVVAACGGSSPVGVYDVDKKAFKDVMLASMPAAARENKDALAQVDAMVGGMETTVELKADGAAHMHMKMSMMGREMNESADGSWKLDGGKLTIAMKKDGKDDTKVADFDGKSFSIEDDAGGQKMKMTFHRR